MKTKAKLLKSKVVNNKTLLENFSFLSLLQLSNLLIFLFMIPYLFRVLGKENYGLVVFAQTISIYYSIVVNFGFNVTGTKDVSMNRSSHSILNEIISDVLSLKVLFFLIMVFINTLFILFIPIFRAHPALFIFSMFACLSDALFPIWYFQGIEKMRYITFINITARVLSAAFLFMLIKSASDFTYVPLIQGLGSLFGAFAGLYILFVQKKHKFTFISKNKISEVISVNVPLFLSNVSSQIYVNANKIIVGSFLGMQEVAIYDVADKITNLLKVPINLIGQTLFPRVSRDKNTSFVKMAMIIVLVFCLVVYLGVFIFSKQIIFFFSGSSSNDAVILLRILSASILPICLGLFYAELLLVPFGYLKEYAKMRAVSLVVYLSCTGTIIVTKEIGIFKLAMVIIVVETFVLAYSYYLCKRKKII